MTQAQHHVQADGPIAVRTASTDRARRTSRAGRRFGYLVAILVNLAGLWIVNHLLAWGWPPFLTPDFEELLPYVNAAIVATLVVNVAWFCWDPRWLRHLGQVATNAVSFLAVVRTWQIFPFDVTGYWSGWTTLGRLMLVVACVGLVIDTIVRLVALARGTDPA